ncbi:MAG: nitroreductase family protein [Candidatus Eisenbacteria bacterium]|uniref:Nitroreductase family protein n=1 Tax=Eiseniibacteriota bacterium TaxID=2212470 RepID=A0A956RPI8_UNCEI|nr:nitroreductase family protein [Candidatus Eisenbacteria bacterium]
MSTTHVDSLSHVLLHHRSIRSYRPDPVDPALIEEVCAEAVAGASSSGNLNSISLILTRDPERKRRLWELHSEQDMILEAPLLITFCADWFRTREWLRLRGARDNFNNFLGYHVGAFDAMILAQNVCLGFEARGLGICYMGTTLDVMPEIAELLELPDTCAPVTTIVVGHPAEDPAKRDRLPMSALIHDETYHRPSEEELLRTYEQREVRGWARYMSYPELKAEIERRGITSLAQFYTSDAKYAPDDFMRTSEKIRAFLAEKHFLP